MRMSALKRYFESARREAAELAAGLDEDSVSEDEPIVDQEKLDEVAYVLRTWVVYKDQDLLDYLSELDDEEYAHALELQTEFPPEVQTILRSQEVPRIGLVSKYKLVDLTDELFFERKMKAQKQFNLRVEQEVAKCSIEPRPRGQPEEYLESLQQELQTQEANLERAMSRVTAGKYLPPSMRKLAVESDPLVLRHRTSIAHLKTEIDSQQSRIEKANNEWRKRKEFELKHKITEMLMLQ